MSFSGGSRTGGVGVVADRLTPQTSDLEVWVQALPAHCFHRLEILLHFVSPRCINGYR